MGSKARVETFINPAGFIEQQFRGAVKASAVEAAVRKLDRLVNQQKTNSQPALVLINASLVATSSFFDIKSHAIAIRGMKTIRLDKAAIYGPLVTQVTVNTLAMVAGKQGKIRGFTNREEAIRWLRTGKS